MAYKIRRRHHFKRIRQLVRTNDCWEPRVGSEWIESRRRSVMISCDNKENRIVNTIFIVQWDFEYSLDDTGYT